MQTLTAMPDSFSKGSSVSYTKAVPDYPATDGWALTVHIAGRSVAHVNAGTSGADFVVTMAPAVTSTLEPGVYTWLERVSKAGEIVDVGNGTLAITADLATATTGELRSFDEKALEAIEAALLVNLADPNVSYQVAGRGAVSMSRTEAMKLRDTLARRIARRKNGGRIGQNVNVRFRRP